VVVLERGAMALAQVAQTTQPVCIHDWENFISTTDRFCQSIRILHPLPLSPFRRHNPWEEPGALSANAGIGGAGGWQQPSIVLTHLGAPFVAVGDPDAHCIAKLGCTVCGS
jgi:hypothetical protein